MMNIRLFQKISDYEIVNWTLFDRQSHRIPTIKKRYSQHLWAKTRIRWAGQKKVEGAKKYYLLSRLF
jgi:hypothetical protein